VGKISRLRLKGWPQQEVKQEKGVTPGELEILFGASAAASRQVTPNVGSGRGKKASSGAAKKRSGKKTKLS